VLRAKDTWYSCSREWGVRRESTLEGLRVPFPKFLIARKLFELDTSVREDSKQPGLANNCVDNIDTLISEVFLATDANPVTAFFGEIEMDESHFGGRRKGKRSRGAAGKVPVFGISERGGEGTVEVVPHVQGETLLELAIKKGNEEVSYT
jgi:transposase